MAHLLQNNSKIRGIKIRDVETVISQFADDSSLFLEYSQEVLTEALNVMQRVEDNIGLTINYDKTSIYRVGSLQYTDAQLYTHKKLQWSDGDLELLGIKIKNNLCQDTTNVDLLLNKMQNIADVWYYRNLTIMGKILIINSLMSSLFIYQIGVTPPITKAQQTRYEAIVNKFLWHEARV